MNITRLSISRPVGISMIVAFFVVLGLYSYYRIGVELLPALNTPYVTVTVKYPGASAESVEQEIIKPVEDAVSSVSNVKSITSVASYERGRVMMEMNFDADADLAAIEATKKVEAIKNKLPDEADAPVVIKRDINAKPIMELAVMSQQGLGTTYSMTEHVFQDVLQQAGGVSEIELHGGRDKEVAVEVDRALEPVLAELLADAPNARVVFQDILKADVAQLVGEAFDGEPYRVVANLPYYITADILLRLASSQRPPESISIMVQREAAERLMSAPGSKQWCALAAELQYYGDARVLAEVPPEAFDPPPHVTSCFMRIDAHAEPIVRPKDPALFRRLIRAAFAMRRKTLANNLKASFGLSQQAARDVLAAAGVDERTRGEALTLEELCGVSDAICMLHT